MRTAIIENKEYEIIGEETITRSYARPETMYNHIYNGYRGEWTYNKTVHHVTVRMINPPEDRERIFVLGGHEYDELLKSIK